MIIDLLVIGFLALSGVSGLRSGTIKQLTHWAGLVLGRAGAKPLALILTLALAPRLGFPPVYARVGLAVLCFYTIYVLGISIAHPLMKKLAGKRAKTPIDRAGGFLLGVGKGATLVLVLLSVTLFFEQPLKSALGNPPEPLQHSLLVGLVRRHNIFGAAPSPALARLDQLMRAARSPHSARELAGDPRIAELLNDPALKASLQDDSLARAVKSGDWSALKDDPRVVALLKDPRIRGPLVDPLDDEAP